METEYWWGESMQNGFKYYWILEAGVTESEIDLSTIEY